MCFTSYANTELLFCQLGDSPRGRSGTRSEGICGAQTGLLLQTTWVLMVMSHRPTHSTAWAQPRSQSSVLVSEEPTTIPQLQPASGFLPAWQTMDEILTGELFLAPAARQARNDPVHDGMGAWAKVGIPLWLPGRNQLSSDAVVMGQLEILSKKYIKTYCLASLRETVSGDRKGT